MHIQCGSNFDLFGCLRDDVFQCAQIFVHNLRFRLADHAALVDCDIASVVTLILYRHLYFLTTFVVVIALIIH